MENNKVINFLHLFIIPHLPFFPLLLKASGQTLKFKKLHVKGKKTSDSKKAKKGPLTGDTEDEDSASASSSLKRGNKDLKKRKMEESTSMNLSKQESSASSIKKPKQDDSKDLALCRYYFSCYAPHIHDISFV